MQTRAATREATREVLVFILGKEEYAVDIGVLVWGAADVATKSVIQGYNNFQRNAALDEFCNQRSAWTTSRLCSITSTLFPRSTN